MAKQDQKLEQDPAKEEFTKQEKKSNKRTLAQILEFHNQKVKNSKKVLVGNKIESAFEWVANTSGGLFMIPDFRAQDIDPSSQEVIVLEPGEIVNLLTMYEPISINRNRKGLLNAFKMKSTLNKDLPALTCVEHDEIEFPFPLQIEGIVKRAVAKGMGRIEDPGFNEYDIKLQKDYEKEEKANQKLLDSIKNKTDFSKRKSAEEVNSSL